jgi:LacI family transcriptional regulator
LLELGHRDIGFLTGLAGSAAAPLRVAGYREAHTEARLDVREDRISWVGWDIDGGLHGAMKMLDGVSPAERPTAILCANDRAAIGVVLAAARLGLSVPGDLSIMGYDDESHVADTMVPALTTMALPLREMGAAAMKTLLEQIEGPGKSENGQPAGLETLVPCRLVVRESTGRVPAGRA